MSYYDIQVSANLHRPIKSNQGLAGRRQGKSLEGVKVPRGPGGIAPLSDAFYEKFHRS